MRLRTSSESSSLSERRYRLRRCWAMRWPWSRLESRLDPCHLTLFLLRRRAHCMLFFLSKGWSDWSLLRDSSPFSLVSSHSSTLTDTWDWGGDTGSNLYITFKCVYDNNTSLVTSVTCFIWMKILHRTICSTNQNCSKIKWVPLWKMVTFLKVHDDVLKYLVVSVYFCCHDVKPILKAVHKCVYHFCMNNYLKNVSIIKLSTIYGLLYKLSYNCSSKLPLRR